MKFSDFEKIDINTLFQKLEITKQTCKVCKENQFENLKKIIEYFLKNGTLSFYYLKNCKEKSSIELENLTLKYISIFLQESENENFSLLSETKEQRKSLLSFDDKRETIELIFQKEIGLLSKRARNLLIENHIDCNTFYTDYMSDNKSFSFFLGEHNIGNNTIIELDALKVQMLDYIEKIKNSIKDEQTLIQPFIIKYGEICKDVFFIDFFKKYNSPPMFWLVEKLITKKEMGQLSLREQINLIDNNRNIYCHENDWEHYLSSSEDIIFFDSATIQFIIDNEGTKFYPQSILHILSLFNKFAELKMDEKNEKLFIVNNELCEYYAFETFINNVNCSIVNHNDFEEEKIPLSDFLPNNEYIKLPYCERILLVLRKIFLQIYCLEIDVNDCVILPQRREISISEALLQVLEESGGPMNILDILSDIKKILPNHKYDSVEKIRPFLLKNEKIVHINRCSAYGLKEWKHIKMGTIRDAIVEYLSLQNTRPQSLEKIAEHIQKHFSRVTKNSINSTIHSDTKERFKFFEGGLIGLPNIIYPQYFIERTRANKYDFDSRIADLRQFILLNNRFPFSSSSDDKEVSLFKWWSRITKGQNIINTAQEEIVEQVWKDFGKLLVSKNDYQWDMNYQNYKDFIFQNHYKPNDSRLEGWIIRAKIQYENQKLNKEQEEKYRELRQLITIFKIEKTEKPMN